jgi:hypothetical protein
MLNEIEDMLINKFIQKLSEHGVQIDAATIKKAIANSPQIIQQVEAIMQSNSQDRFPKIIALIKQAAGNASSGSTNPPAA